MRKLSLWILGIMLLAAACTPTTPSYTIGGQFDNAPGHMAYLHYINGSQLRPYDSTQIATDGSFAFSGDSLKSSFVLLSVVSPDKKVTNYIQLLVQQGDNIVLGGDAAKNLKTNYTVQGSAESTLINELNMALLAASAKLDNIAKEYRDNAAKQQLDSAKKANFDTRNKATLAAHRKYSEGFIQQHDSSLVSVMALFQAYNNREWVFNITNDITIFETVLNNTIKLYPQSEMIKTLKLRVSDHKLRVAKHEKESKTAEIGSVAPEILLPNPQGKELALSSLRGKYVLLDFWAAWCGPCRRENPNLVSAYKKYRRKGFRIYQVSLDKDMAEWTKAIKKDKLNWHHVSDLRYWQCEAAKLYNVVNIPTNYLIDPQGRIVATNLRGDKLKAKLKEIYE